ncbi:MAG: hypothetical protein CFE31_10910 [Rhizobiales bacterium PAR1]|nr:MAG: hypothetical protein CFE31_10910 [Rhizobiales bacterium PAR1]
MKLKTSALQKNLQSAIRTQLIRMTVLMLGLVGLVTFAGHFVWNGLVSNTYLNGCIVVVFLFGCMLAFRRVIIIRNDATAFSALQEAFDDARKERTEALEDPYWRHYRCMKPGTVFGQPKSLGHMFELAYDELLRAKSLNISVSTMQNVIAGIEARLSDERAQVTYLTGLLIFLGLIGTFIGLMEMVGSVGAIIGGLNTTSGGSSDTMKTLLANLQVPLNGMATGFSSSLFGLFGSLVLGLLSRFGTQALNILKDEFSSWLAGVSHLESGQRGDTTDLARLIADNLSGTGGGGGAQGGARNAGGVPGSITDVGVVATMAQGFGRMNQGVDTIGQLLPRMLDLQTEQAAMMKALLAGMDKMVSDSGEIREHMSQLVSAQGTNAEYMQELINLQRTTESRLTSGFNGMAHIMEVTGQAYLDGLRRLTSENYETNARLAKLLDVKAAGDRITEIAVGIESKVKNGFGGLASVLERTAMSIDSSMQRVAQDQADLKEVLMSRGVGGGENVGMSPEFEERLSAGFSEISRSFETVFAAYSTIVNRSLVQQAMDKAEPGPAPVAMPLTSGAALPEHETRPQQKPEIEIDHEELRRKLLQAARSNRGGSAA